MLPCDQIKLDVSDKKDAVSEAGKFLLHTDAILSEYIDALIQTAEELGLFTSLSKPDPGTKKRR